MNEQIAKPMSDAERAENSRAIHKMHVANRFRLMFGQPLLPETQLNTPMLSTTILGPYDDVSTGEKTIVSAAIPPEVKERLFVDFLPRRGAVDKLITRQLYSIDAFLCKHPTLISLDETVREEVVNNLLNKLVDFLDELKPETLL
jgi:hypothetical protein